MGDHDGSFSSGPPLCSNKIFFISSTPRSSIFFLRPVCLLFRALLLFREYCIYFIKLEQSFCITWNQNNLGFRFCLFIYKNEPYTGWNVINFLRNSDSERYFYCTFPAVSPAESNESIYEIVSLKLNFKMLHSSRVLHSETWHSLKTYSIKLT